MPFYILFVAIICGLIRQGALSPERPKLNPLAFPSSFTVGSRANLICSAFEGELPLNFHWLKDNKDADFFNIEKLNDWTFSLVIYPVSLEHIGNYTCVVTNAIGSDQVTASLFVTAQPQWIVDPSNEKVEIGGRARFDCSAEGSPAVKATWKKQDASKHFVPITYTSGVYVLKNNSLVLSNVQKFQSGSYMCEVSNGIGDGLTKIAELTVYEHPVVERPEDHIIVEHGQAAHLYCLVKGDAPLTLAWMKDHRLLSEWPKVYDRITFSEQRNNGSIKFVLNISNTVFEDEGFYTCTGSNDYGSDKKDIRLLLVEKPKPPNHVEIVDVWSRSIRLKWSVPSNGNSPILSYTIEYWSTPGGHWNETVSSSTTSHIIRSLTPYTHYHYHLLATNKVGDSVPSHQGQFMTAKEEPSAPPRDVQLEDIGSTYVRVSFKPPPKAFWNGNITGYYIGYRQSSSKLPYTLKTVEADDDLITYVLRGLKKSTEYMIIVQAFNSIGNGPPGEALTFETDNKDPRPQPNLMVKDIGSTFIQISWHLNEGLKHHITGYKVYFRKFSGKWQEIPVPDAAQDSFTLTNLDSGVPYQIYVMAFYMSSVSEPSEIATVRTTAEAIFHVESPASSRPSVSDDVAQILNIVIPVAAATVIIVIVIVVACVYVYSRRPPPMLHPYSDGSCSKGFTYMATVPRHRDMSVPVCGVSAMKYSSPYSSVPLTRPEQDEEEPIYEAVIDEIRDRIKQKSYDDVKISDGTIV